MNEIMIFAIATVINVTLSTVRALCTIKGGKWISAIMNALCYGFYPLIVMLTAQGTVGILVNMAITAIVNFACVWLIKYIEEKAKKDKLWKIEATFSADSDIISALDKWANVAKIPYNYIDIKKYYVVNFYCATQQDSLTVKNFITAYQGKYFASESKNL